jgi:HTH-type transcriptional regulator / antitoxin HigA
MSDNSISKIINSAFNGNRNSLAELFEDKLKELDISQTTALEIMEIESRALNGIINGNQKQLDISSLLKICEFVGIDHINGFELYLQASQNNNKIQPLDTLQRNKFIVENFDLPNLKKTNFIDSIKDFDAIEKKINTYFGFNSIFEYKRLNITPAFKSTKRAKNELQTRFWISSAVKQFSRINNPNSYKRTELINLMPSFRDWTMEPGQGFLKVFQSLYNLGVTLIFQPSMAALQIKGSTIPVNDKPCIVLSDFGKSYPSLWFSLIHELFHVVFDWDSIRVNNYLLSIEGDEAEREIEADLFATDYLMPHNFEKALSTNYNDLFFIEQVAKKNKIHPSVILYTYGNNRSTKIMDTGYWIQVNSISPKLIHFKKLIHLNDWANPIPANENAINIKNQIH